MKHKREITKAFENFFKKNFPKVKAFSMKLLMSEKDAEDAAQDVFLKLLDRPDIWKNEEIADKYLFTMTKNYIFNFIKHQKVETTYYQSQEQNSRLVQDFSLEENIHAREVELIIRHTIENMPQQRKMIFHLSRYEGKSNLEIANITNLSIRTVERHIYLALIDLKKTLLIYFPD